MENLREKKKELINFIMWKMKNSSEEDKKETLKKIKGKSYVNLREWAIRNGFID